MCITKSDTLKTCEDFVQLLKFCEVFEEKSFTKKFTHCGPHRTLGVQSQESLLERCIWLGVHLAIPWATPNLIVDLEFMQKVHDHIHSS